jgi:Ser/Thr protein kinase RdoA (MazF antagonist)
MHVRDGECAVYAFQSGNSRRFLRLTEDRHRGRRQLEAELDFVRFVTSQGVAAARPLASAQGG